jgi:hypothetical protein
MGYATEPTAIVWRVTGLIKTLLEASEAGRHIATTASEELAVAELLAAEGLEVVRS